MANKKKFVNPLTKSSEEELNIQKSSTDTSKYTDDQKQVSLTPSEYQPLRKRGNQSFEKTHQRFTGWIEKGLKQQFEKLVAKKNVSKASLLNEALADLLRKYSEK
jgi:predicted RNA-binding protein with RPS1 domain